MGGVAVSHAAPNRHAFIFPTPSVSAPLSLISKNLCPVISPALLFPSSPRICEVATNGLRGEVGGWGVDPSTSGRSEPGGCESAPGVRFRPRRPCRQRGTRRSGGIGRSDTPGTGLQSRQPGNEFGRGKSRSHGEAPASVTCGTTPLRGSEPRRPHLDCGTEWSLTSPDGPADASARPVKYLPVPTVLATDPNLLRSPHPAGQVPCN